MSEAEMHCYIEKGHNDYAVYIPKFGITFRGKTEIDALDNLFEHVLEREPKLNLSAIQVVHITQEWYYRRRELRLIEQVTRDIHAEMDRAVLADLFAAP